MLLPRPPPAYIEPMTRAGNDVPPEILDDGDDEDEDSITVDVGARARERSRRTSRGVSRPAAPRGSRRLLRRRRPARGVKIAARRWSRDR